MKTSTTPIRAFSTKKAAPVLSRIEIMTQWIRDRQHLLNISGIAREIDVSPVNLNKMIAGMSDGHGRKMKIPKRCEKALLAVLLRLKYED